MLDLSRVTLCTICTRDFDACRVVLDNCRAVAKFAQTVVFTNWHLYFSDVAYCVSVEPREYRQWCVYRMTELPKQRDKFTDFILFVESDALVVNPSAWTDEFFKYDMIGAPWHDRVVGNWGFALFSQKFLWALEALRLPSTIAACSPCDWLSGRVYRPKLEALGCRFAPYAVANRFANETGEYQGAFGVHGVAMLQIIKNNWVGWADEYGKKVSRIDRPAGSQIWQMPTWSESFLQPFPPLADQCLLITPTVCSKDHPPLLSSSRLSDADVKAALADASQRHSVCAAAVVEWLELAHRHNLCGNGSGQHEAEANAEAWKKLAVEDV